MPDPDQRLELDAATLAAELDLRWPGATGSGRAATDETHRLALLHPDYDGFLSLEVTARAELDGVFVVPEAALSRVVTAHHRTGPLARGQRLPIDLELHPGNVPPRGTTGLLELVDASGAALAPPVRLTLATDPTLECELAGAVDGPFPDQATFEAAVLDLLEARETTRHLARRVRALAAGAADPGVRRRWWRRR